MSGENLPNKTQGVASFTNVPLAPVDDKGPARNPVIYACHSCDKSYDKKSSYQSHMRTKHRVTKEVEVEKGTNTTQRKKGQGFSQWIENEVDRPLLLTRELDSFLTNRSDKSLVVAARASEEAEVQVEKLEVRNHELEWFEEDNNIEFNEEFASEFASSLRRDSLPTQPDKKVAELHNNLLKKQIEKYDAMVVRTTRILNANEACKNELRKRIKSLEKEVEETQENWQGSCEADSEEIANLKATITAKNIKINELELAASRQDDKVKYNCGKCGMSARDGATLKQHMKSIHKDKQGKKCPKCPRVVANEKLFRMHVN